MFSVSSDPDGHWISCQTLWPCFHSPKFTVSLRQTTRDNIRYIIFPQSLHMVLRATWYLKPDNVCSKFSIFVLNSDEIISTSGFSAYISDQPMAAGACKRQCCSAQQMRRLYCTTFVHLQQSYDLVTKSMILLHNCPIVALCDHSCNICTMFQTKTSIKNNVHGSPQKHTIYYCGCNYNTTQTLFSFCLYE